MEKFSHNILFYAKHKSLNFIYLTISFLFYTLYYSGILAALDMFKSFWISFVLIADNSFSLKRWIVERPKNAFYNEHTLYSDVLWCTLSSFYWFNMQRLNLLETKNGHFFHHCAPNSRENVHIRDHQSFMATFAINGKTQLKITFLYDSQKWDLHIVWWSQ